MAAEPLGDGAVEPARAGIDEVTLRRIAAEGQPLDELTDGGRGRVRVPARTQEQAEPRRPGAVAAEAACGALQPRRSVPAHLAVGGISSSASESGDETDDGRIGRLARPLVSRAGEAESPCERLVSPEVSGDRVEQAALIGVGELLRRRIALEAMLRHEVANSVFAS